MNKFLAILAVMLIAVCFSAVASAGPLLNALPSFSASASSLTSTITGTNPAAIVSGPTLTIAQAGTYLLTGSISTEYSSATMTGRESVTCRLYRTNNTPGSISNSLSSAATSSLSTTTVVGPTLVLPLVSYTTATTTDTIQAYCGISADPSAGALNATGVSLFGIRFK